MRKPTMSFHGRRQRASAPPGLRTRYLLPAAMLALIVAVACSGSASAGTVFTQAGVDGYSYDGDYHESYEHYDPQFGNYWVEGVTSASASYLKLNSGSPALAIGVAKINLGSDPGFHFQMTAISDGITDYTRSSSQVQGYAQWVDVLRVAGATPPAELQIHLNIEGTIWLHYSSVAVSQASGRIGIGQVSYIRGSEPGNAFGGDLDSGLGLGAYSFGGTDVIQEAGDINHTRLYDLNAEVGAFDGQSAISGSKTYTLAYDPDLQGYQLNLLAGAQASSWGSADSYVDLLHTISLTDVTLLDGTSLAGEVTFDSGFQLPTTSGPGGMVTPEPTSLALASFAGIGMAIGVLRRRRQTPVQDAKRTAGPDDDGMQRQGAP